MSYLGILVIVAVVHLLLVKDIFNIHSWLVDCAFRLPYKYSSILVRLLNCPFCFGFWIGTIGYFVSTLDILSAIMYGLACYGTMVIAVGLNKDFTK